MTVDNEGNLYVTGTSGMLPNDNTGLSGDDAKTIKYNANGDEQWVANYHNDNLPEFYGGNSSALLRLILKVELLSVVGLEMELIWVIL